ncbi:RNA methyltransferase [Geitlerinema sp. PCC 9228]|jgi:TrmH family RNA methyltransferase|uniref:TrmH family RNA methyltransferase n=1 Tax=Geitlerinema sp. PCC 9228 TaxID=111611 RepID=UPI0008F99A7B|nr:RNA methyltransferase [Geitlerinema sp. PCC 9228]
MLSSLQNPLVKQMRKLQQPKGRRQQGWFLLEGTHLLQEAIAFRYPLAVVCATAQWQENHPHLWQQLVAGTARVETVSEAVLEAIATTVHPDGIVAAASPKYRPMATLPIPGIGVVLETIQDPGNLGTIIRTAAATEAAGLWLSGDSVDCEHPKVLRATAGQWFRLPMRVSENLVETLQSARQQGMQIVATTAGAKHTYWEIDYTQPTLVLLGNEGAGLSAELQAIAHWQVKIPLSAAVESLNVAIATALILYEGKRQKQNR